jgi:hypothetical protein
MPGPDLMSSDSVTDGSENKDLSQRVEFRVRTNADAQISEILKAGQK